ncbi:MAG TPA: tetratricopeptide repeat protein [Candidatus Polarisedimenticolia bacterium]|nr:tetratricopeptide repeat protein [Candidatus Polarisedimenticolia bacterium]
MKIRTVTFLMIGAIVVVVLSILYIDNKEALDRQIFFGHSLSMPVWLCFLVVSFLSMLVPLLFGMVREARRVFGSLTARRAAASQQEAERRYLSGIESMLNGREERALEEFNSVLALNPNHFYALLKGGEVLRTMRRHAEAIEYHRRASRVRDKDLQPLYSLVADYEESGAIENAKAILNRIIELNPKRSLNAYRKFRTICISEKSWEKAWEIQQKIEGLLSQMGYPRTSEKKYHLAIRYMLARRYLEQDRAREAIGVLRRLVHTDAGFVPAHLRLGSALAGLGQSEEAVQVWEEGFKATDHPIFLTTIVDHHLEDEQPRKAIEALKSALWVGKKDIIPRFFLGKLYFRLEMIDEALQEFTRLRGRVARFPALHHHLAKIHERQGQYPEALREMETVLLETDALQVDYVCRICERKYASWVEYCSRCAEWNSVDVDFREERDVEDLGLSTAPVYTVEEQEA